MRYVKSFANDSAIQEAVDNKTLGKPYVALNDQTGKIDWNGKDIDYSKMYLTIEALENGRIRTEGDAANSTYYSINGGEWHKSTISLNIWVSAGDEVRFKGTAGGNSLFSGNTLAFDVYGNVESLEYGDNFVGQTSNNVAFTGLFSSCTGLVDASNLVLPATTLVRNCYGSMFQGCTSLTTAPAIPATTLAIECYAGMFSNCTSLTTAPDLPATTLATRCYYQMFYNCSSLTAAPVLPATTLVWYSYQSMFQGCTSLTSAPELPATTLKNGCYNQMFQSCTNLNYIKCLATDISASNCTLYWVSGVASTGTFYKNPAMSSWTTGTDGIPSGWTVIEE